MSVALLAACSGAQSRVSAPGGERASLAEGAFAPLSTRGGDIVDAAGRTVILRALQHHGLQDVDYAGREFADTDFARVASFGFSALRMAISWSRIEPERGRYDEAYLGRIAHVLDLAAAAGPGVVLEWHQDAWGRCSQPAGTPVRQTANGAPDWTCPADYEPSLLGFYALTDRLWNDEDGLLESWIAAWTQVVSRFGRHPAVLGWDLYNEPSATGASPSPERDRIFPAMRRLVPAMRAAGAGGLFLVNAPLERNETFRMYTEPLDDLGPGAVFAPHLYSGWLLMYSLRQRVSPSDKARDFAAALAQGEALHLPVWNGEWGVNLLVDGSLEDMRTHVETEDASRVGSSYWSFSREVPGQANDSVSGGQALLDRDGRLRTDAIRLLSRPYPVQTPGRLEKFRFAFDTHTLSMELSADAAGGAPLVVYAPAVHLGDSVCLEVQGPGRWRWDEAARERILVEFGAAGSWTVALRPCGGGE